MVMTVVDGVAPHIDSVTRILTVTLRTLVVLCAPLGPQDHPGRAAPHPDPDLSGQVTTSVDMEWECQEGWRALSP
jgi:hypothetical protein